MMLQSDYSSSSVIKNHECESEPNIYARIQFVKRDNSLVSMYIRVHDRALLAEVRKIAS